MEPIRYTDDENALIKDFLNLADFSSNYWSKSEFDIIREKIKDHYLNVQGLICPYCRRNLQTKNKRNWDIEHVISRSSMPHFMFEPLNLCVSCIDCNIAKSDTKITSSTAKKKYPTRSELFYIVHPHLDNYSDFVIVVKEGFLYIAKSQKGIHTINVCNLNRFYESAGFGAGSSNDEMIFLLSESLANAKDEATKIKLRRQIAELSIQGI